MKKLRRNMKKLAMSSKAKVIGAVGAVTLGATNASAAYTLDLTNFAIDMKPVFDIAGIIIVALGAVWGLYKAIGLLSK